MFADPLKSIATIASMVVAVIVLGFGGYLLWQHLSANHAMVKAQVQAGTATVAAGQARAEQAAQTVVVQGEARDHVDLTIHQENADALQAAPGADAPIDPALNRTGLVGLCRHPAYTADPRCHQLLPLDSAIIPGASGANAASPY